MKRLFKSSQPKFAFEEFKTLEDRIALRTSKSIPNFILCVLEPPNCKKEDTITMLIKETDNLTRITIAIRQKKEINPT